MRSKRRREQRHDKCGWLESRAGEKRGRVAVHSSTSWSSKPRASLFARASLFVRCDLNRRVAIFPLHGCIDELMRMPRRKLGIGGHDGMAGKLAVGLPESREVFGVDLRPCREVPHVVVGEDREPTCDRSDADKENRGAAGPAEAGHYPPIQRDYSFGKQQRKTDRWLIQVP